MPTDKNINKKLLFLGDSLTYGYGVRRADCWVTLAAEKLGFEFVNCGISGDTSCGMLARFPLLLKENRPDIVFVMGGSNDIIYSKSEVSARSCIGAIIQQAQAAGVKPIIGVPPRVLYEKISDNWRQFADFRELEAIFEEYAGWLRSFAMAFEVPLVDFSEILYNDTDSGLSLDGIHPDKEGHKRMSELFIKKLTENLWCI